MKEETEEVEIKMSIKNPKKTLEQRRRLRRKMTEAEELFWSRVRNKQLDGLRVKRQYGLGPYILDFYIPKYKLAIELDGGVHSIGLVIRKDQNKDAFLNENGISVLRLENEIVLKNIEAALKKVILQIRMD